MNTRTDYMRHDAQQNPQAAPADDHRRNSCKLSIVLNAVFILSALLAGFALRDALRFGRLAIPPTYDDVVYFLAAVRWVAAAPDLSFFTGLYSLLAQHSPFATALAIIGLALTPGHFVGPYALNGVVIGAFLATTAVVLRELPLSALLTVVVALASFPLLTQAVAEARPDLAWGLAVSVIIAAIVHKPLLGRSYTLVFAIGFASGLATLVKPSALPASFACVMAAIGGTALLDVAMAFRARGSKTKPIAYRVLLFILGHVLALAPYLAVMSQHIFGYIFTTLFSNRDFWSYDASIWQQLVFYLTAPGGGGLALGPWLWVGIALFAVRLYLNIVRGSGASRTLLLLFVVLFAYVVPTASVVKSYFLGAMFYGLFACAAALNIGAILAHLSRISPLSAQGSEDGHPNVGGSSGTEKFFLFPPGTHLLQTVAPFAAAIALIAQLSLGARIATTFDQNTAEQIRSSSQLLWSLLQRIQNDANSPTPLHVAFLSPFPVNPTTIELYAELAKSPVKVEAAFFERNFQGALTKLKQAEIMVVSSSIPHNLPGPQMGDDIMKSFADDTSLCVLRSKNISHTVVLRVYGKPDFGCEVTP